MPSPIGIYFGTENVDVLSLSGTFQNPKILTFARSRLPDEKTWRSQTRVEGPEAGIPASSTAAQESSQAIARVIQTILPKLGVNAVKAFISIPAESVVIRYFQMPTIPSHERKMAIAFEAKKYLPFKLEELITDYEVVTRRSDPALMRVMFFGIKRSSVAMYSSLFQASGITPLCLEPAPISLMRLVRHTGQLSSGQVAAILHMEHDSATISIARDDLLYLSRNVSILPGGEGMAGGPESPSDLLEALVNETRVSVDYYRRRFLGEPAVQKVIVFGQEMDSKRISDLAGALDLPVVPGNPFSKIAGATTLPPGLAVTAGLALRGMEKRPREINLLPPDQRRHGEGLLKPLMAEIAAALVLLGVWYGLSVADLNAQRERVQALRAGQSFPEQVSPASTNADLQQIKSSRDKELQMIRSISDFPVKPSEILVQLSKLIPQEAWLQQVFFRESLQTSPSARRRALRLIGTTYSSNRDAELQRTNDFLSALRSDKLFNRAFSEFSLDSVQRTQFRDEDVTEFLITCASHPEEMKKEFSSSAAPTRRGRP